MINGSVQVPQKPAPTGRMTLGAISRSSSARGLRVLLYGTEGIGKTTFAAGAPSPVFLGPEDGFGTLDEEDGPRRIPRFPTPETWSEVLEAVATLAAGRHEYKTLVLDTLDWIEPLVWKHVCKRSNKPDIEAFGYGKGYVAAAAEWAQLLASLERMQRDHSQMHVVMLAHAHVGRFKNPEAEDYGRHTLKVHERSAGLLKEWNDCVLFATYATRLIEVDGRTKAFGGEARVVHTERRAGFDAKNRHGLPPTIALDWSEFFGLVQSGGVSLDALARQVAVAIEQLPEAERPEASKWLEHNKTNANALRLGLNKLRARGLRTE